MGQFLNSLLSVQACAGSDFTGKCGEWSQQMEAATLDGIPGKPSDVVVTCTADSMNLTWGPPEKPNAEIKGYTVSIILDIKVQV